MSKYSSTYPSEVVYGSDKNFLVRLKVMIDRNMKAAGYSTSHRNEQFMNLIQSLNNAEDCLFDKSESTPSSTEVMREALEGIIAMKLNPEETDYKYAFNRCWHLADKALSTQREETKGEDQYDEQLLTKCLNMLRFLYKNEYCGQHAEEVRQLITRK